MYSIFFNFYFYEHFIKFVSKLPVLDSVCLLFKTRGWQNVSRSLHFTRRTENLRLFSLGRCTIGS